MATKGPRSGLLSGYSIVDTDPACQDPLDLLSELARERARFTAAVLADDREAAKEHQVRYRALERQRRAHLLSQAAEREAL